MKQSATPRFMTGFDEATHKKLSGDVRAEMGRYRISVNMLAKEIGYTRTTVNLWLVTNVTQERFDKMMNAINRIVEKKGV